MIEATEAPARAPSVPEPPRQLSGPAKVWMLTVFVGAMAVGLTLINTGLPGPGGSYAIAWWVLAPMFYLAEFAVVHLRFRRDAHSFSMSEIPMVLGLFFAGPVGLVAGQLLGNVVALTVNRRQPPLKVAFNLAQFAVQSSLAIMVFRLIADLGDPFGAAGWAGAMAGALVSLVVADGLINTAIRLSGGDLHIRQMIEVLKLSALATLMNTSLGLAGVMVLSANPDAAWLALAPPVTVFLAYRAYVSQRQEGSRLQSLYEATRVLHRSPQIESALSASAEQALTMFEAEFVEVFLFPSARLEKAFVTAVGPGDRRVVLEPAHLDLDRGLWPDLVGQAKAMLVGEYPDRLLPRPHADDHPAEEVIIAPLAVQNEVVGAILVANRVGDVSRLELDDLRLLEALASQVSVSIENGRLEDSLVQLTDLKERLEALVRSKDQFVATVSHELRTPLTAIFGLSHELTDRRTSFSGSELDEMARLIADQSAELSDMIDDLLVAARADIGTLRVDRESFDVGAEIASVIDAHFSMKKGPRPAFDRAADPQLVSADALRTRQILRNLLTNAERYGGDTIHVETATSGRVVTISVIDNGAGVPEGEADAIFEPYQTAHHRTTEPGSVGLGLVVSRTLAHLMGGDLRYLRREGHTVFQLTLPRAEQA